MVPENLPGVCMFSGLAIAKRLKAFGVKRTLYSGRTAKAYAGEVGGEFGKKIKMQRPAF